MKLDTSKYKITLMTEDVCPSCQEVKQLFDNNLIKYQNKCITAQTPPNYTVNQENADNRWEFHDLADKYPDKVRNTPVMIIEDVEGNQEIFSAGAGYETAEEALELIQKNYCL